MSGADAKGPSAIDVRGLDHWFGEVRALHGLDFEAPAGATLVVLGPNGSGKSTLTRILATLLRPTAGEVSVLGASLPREAWKARGRVGYLGHRPLLYGDLTGRENLRYHAALFGFDRAAADERIGALLETSGMRGRAGRRVAEMSAGMAQRIDVCRAVLHDPELIVLDEPGAHLDERARGELEAMVGPTPGRTRVIVTHDIEAGLAGADLALILDRTGHVHYSGPAGAITAPEARRAYAGEEPGA